MRGVLFFSYLLHRRQIVAGLVLEHELGVHVVQLHMDARGARVFRDPLLGQSERADGLTELFQRRDLQRRVHGAQLPQQTEEDHLVWGDCCLERWMLFGEAFGEIGEFFR